jgi:hydroxymethylpyrimidine pyrophosphatase-like HAD family hydrolase
VRGAGHDLVFASARPVRDMLPVLAGAFPSATLIGGNGSLVSVDGRVRARAAFAPDLLGALLEAVGRHGAGYLADGPWDYAYTGPADHPILDRVDQGGLARRVPLSELPEVVKFLAVDASDAVGLVKAGRALGLTVHHHLDEAVVDVAPGTTTKWEALTALGRQEYAAFGNDVNDLDLLRNARHAVRVGAHPALEGVAHVTLAADPEAVAAGIALLAEAEAEAAADRAVVR